MHRSYGITLIETLAVLAILIILSMISIPALNLFRSQRVVKDSATTVQRMFQEARSMASALGKTFYVRFDLSDDSAAIWDEAKSKPVGKRWYAPAAVDIMDIKDKNGNPLLPDIGFKPNGSSTQSVSIRLKRRDAPASDSTKYYTVTVITPTGLARIYPYEKNDPDA